MWSELAKDWLGREKVIIKLLQEEYLKLYKEKNPEKNDLKLRALARQILELRSSIDKITLPKEFC